MIFDPDKPGYAIAYPDGKFAFVFRSTPPIDPIPKLLIFTDKQQAEAYNVPGEIIEKSLIEWHRVGIRNKVTIVIRNADNDYHLPPRIGWDFTGESDTISRVGQLALL